MIRKRISPAKKTEFAALQESSVPYRTDSESEFYPLRTREDQGWADFREQCRRQMQRPIADRIKYGFVRRIKPSPVKQKARAFKTMSEYRAWCEENMPDSLGFKRPVI